MGTATDAAGQAVLETPEAEAYLADTVRVWLGLPATAAVEAPRLPARLARLLLRLEEYEHDERDRWGRWDFDLSENYRAGRHLVAEVDRWVAERRSELARSTRLEPLWPDARRFAVCLTHDVDVLSPRSTLRQVARHARAGLAADARVRERALVRLARPPVRALRLVRSGVARAPSLRETLERSVALESARGAVASYLFAVPPPTGLGRYDNAYAPEDPCVFRERPQRVTDVMRALAREGFDVGLHGSYGAALRPGGLNAERATLESATGLKVRTTRQHLLHWEIRRTPQLQEDAGLEVDSSLGFNRDVGFRAGTSLPFRQFDAVGLRPLELLQIPPIVQDASLLDSWGLQLDLTEGFAVVRKLLDAAAELGTALTLVFHPDKLVRPDWLALYEQTLDHAGGLGGWLTSLSELGDWWRGREARLLGG